MRANNLVNIVRKYLEYNILIKVDSSNNFKDKGSKVKIIDKN